MGWIHESAEDDLYAHEGYCVAVLGDGSDARGTSSWAAYDGREGRALAVAIRARCGCDWTGERIHSVDWSDPEASEGWEDGSGPYADWRGHIQALLQTTLPKAVSELLTALNANLNELAAERPLAVLEAVHRLEAVAEARGRQAAAAARARSASWEEIGRAAGSTRQAAHQRFARHVSEQA